MITIHIVAKNTIQARVIAEELFKRNFIVKALISENMLLLEKNENQTSDSNSTLLVTIGRALYYSDIAALIKYLFPKDEPSFYALPIVNTNIILEKTAMTQE